MKYKETVYSEGYALKVVPEDRAIDVLHHLVTGGLLGGRSLDGVTLEEVEPSEAQKKGAKRLARAMRAESAKD